MKRGSIRYKRHIRKIARKAYDMGYRAENVEFVAKFYRLPISDLEKELLQLGAKDNE